MELNRRPQQPLSQRLAALTSVVLLGLAATSFSAHAQIPPPAFLTSLPACTAPPSPGTDTWPTAGADALGPTAANPVTFSAASLLANDTGAAIALSGIDAISTNGGVITGTDPFTYTPPALFVGADMFSYEIRDSAAQNAIGVVTVTVTADVVPPTVSLSAPAAGAIVSGNVLVTAAASDNVRVAGVTFLDGGAPIGPEVVAAPFQATWQTTLATDGAHTLSAVARDAAGNTATSAAVPVTVRNSATVPAVIGMTQANAQAAITTAGLIVGTISTTNSTAPAGQVVSQSPGVGVSVQPGSSVAITVSLGPAQITVPNVVGLVQAIAQSTISGVGLTVGPITTASSATVPAGVVISQNPTSGTSVATSSAVAIVVSTGPPVVSVPGVVGLAQATAQSTITGAGLTVGAVTTANSATVPAGSVISQNPIAGTPVAPLTAVALVVSSGPVSTGVPTVDRIIFSEGLGKRTTAAFSTTLPGELLVAFGASDGPAAANAQTLTIAGAGLTWTRRARAVTQFGDAEIWTAPAATVLTNVTVSSTQSSAGVHQSLTVIAFSGVGGVGAVNTAGGIGAPSVSLTTTAAGSVVYAVGTDWDRAVARTIPANQTKVHEFVDTAVGDTYWVQALNGTTGPAGSSITLNATSPTTDQWNLAMVELMPGAAPAPVSVPNVVAMTQAAATGSITGAGLTMGVVTTANNPTVPAGSVISQNPAAGVSVAAGSAVAIVVSLGPAPVTIVVPVVTGLTQAAAQSALVGAGLTLGVVTTANSATVPSGLVITQNPTSGASVATGSAVAIVVSLGPAPVTKIVPTVVGLTQAAAQSALVGAGLTLGAVTTANSATVPAGSVITQNPTAGTSVAAGSAVAIVVSLGPATAGPAVDKIVFSDGSGARTTPAFSTAAAGDVLLAFATSDGLPTGTNTQTLTVSGGGLAWTRVQRGATARGVAEIWTATASTPLINVTVTSTQSITLFNGAAINQSLTVVAFTGASGIGASNSGGAVSGAPSVSLVAQAAGSLVYAVGNDFDQALTRSIPAGQTKVHEFLAPTGDTFWVQSANTPTAAAGAAVTLNATAPTGDQWNFAIVELKR